MFVSLKVPSGRWGWLTEGSEKTVERIQGESGLTKKEKNAKRDHTDDNYG
jgi:hypothetical protein